MNRRKHRALYVFSDFIAGTLSWLILYFYRKNVIESAKHGYKIDAQIDDKFIIVLIAIPIMWVLFYLATGYYKDIYRKSRVRDIGITFTTSFVGVVVLFFTLLLDDSVKSYRDYYATFLVLLSAHFFLTLFGRLLIDSYTSSKIKNRIWGFNTLIIGGGESAINLYNELESSKRSEGFFIKGFITIDANSNSELEEQLPCLSKNNNIKSIIKEHKITDVIIALENDEKEHVNDLINTLQNENVHVKVIPHMFSMVLGMVKMNNILGAVMMEVDFEVMPVWQKTVKRIMDLLLSFIALLLLFPVFIILAIVVKLTDYGPVFYKQERIGFKGCPFNIIKFRSMRVDAEKFGPQLSKDNDPRITKIGKIMRKTRLDELPQFFNVLIGEMSIVGPRPERIHFINQIEKEAPYYHRLHRIKPGITSWGQVKYGYAENVTEMVSRLKYDMLYIENMSLALDIKIMIYTALIMIQGRGK